MTTEVKRTVIVCSKGESEVYSPSTVPASRMKPLKAQLAGVDPESSGKVTTHAPAVPTSSADVAGSKITVKVNS